MRLILLLFISLLSYQHLYAQQVTNQSEIDSIVHKSKEKFKLSKHTTEKLISLYTKNGNSVKVYKHRKRISLVLEFNSNEDTLFVKEFYALNKELIFFHEKHIIYKPNTIVDSIRNKDYSVGYEGLFYIIDNFMADGGTMKYNYDFIGYNFPPEPISYILEMIRKHEEYLK